MKRTWTGQFGSMLPCILVMAACLSFSVETAGSTATTTDPPLVNGTWLWNPKLIRNMDDPMLDFLSEANGNALFLQIDQALPIETYRPFMAKAAERGIQIYALDGSPDWAEPQGIAKFDALFSWVRHFNESMPSDQQFAGFHLDIEPYALDGWNQDRVRLVEGFQRVLHHAKTLTWQAGLSLSADMPSWYDLVEYQNGFGAGKLAEWIIRETDFATIMAYADKAEGKNGIIALSKNEVRTAAKYRKKLNIAVETGKLPGQPSVTFYGEAPSNFYKELDKVQTFYRKESGFGGISVHHLYSWMEMMAPYEREALRTPLSPPFQNATSIIDPARMADVGDWQLRQLKNASYRVIIVQADPTIAPSVYREFIRRAGLQQLSVYASAENGDWIGTDSGTHLDAADRLGRAGQRGCRRFPAICRNPSRRRTRRDLVLGGTRQCRSIQLSNTYSSIEGTMRVRKPPFFH
jgi:hypothetical protein